MLSLLFLFFFTFRQLGAHLVTTVLRELAIGFHIHVQWDFTGNYLLLLVFRIAVFASLDTSVTKGAWKIQKHVQL